jgi:NAD(P)-dependent dehydrogenase (short-subunit alcohol dehydrogenase family)
MSEPTAEDVAQGFAAAGRRALVTGAAHGLGLAVATGLRGAGARVVGLDVDRAAVERVAAEHGLEGAVVADLADGEATERAAGEALERLGGLDVLVHCAAVFPLGTLATTPVDVAAGAVDVNALGGVRLVQATVGALRASPAGRIVNFTSTTFLGGVPPEMGGYIVSKAAVIGATRALARELGPDGITVNAIAPGAFPTRQERAMIEDRAAFDAQVLALQAIKRRGDVRDVAAAVLFLASPAAGFITGQTLVVDGGVYLQ